MWWLQLQHRTSVLDQLLCCVSDLEAFLWTVFCNLTCFRSIIKISFAEIVNIRDVTIKIHCQVLPGKGCHQINVWCSSETGMFYWWPKGRLMNINFAASQNVSLVSCLVSFLVFLYFKAGIGSGLFVFFFYCWEFVIFWCLLNFNLLRTNQDYH